MKIGSRIWIFLALYLVGLNIATPAAELQVLPGHLPAGAARLQAVGRLDGSRTLNLGIGLPWRNAPALTNLLSELYDPKSPNYRHFLNPEQFAAQFGPKQEDYDALVAFAEAKGLTVMTKHQNRMLLEVRGSVAVIEKAFRVKLHSFRHPVEPRTFYAPDTEPSVELAVPILHIAGLDNFVLPHPASLRPEADALSPSGFADTPNAGTGPLGSYQGKDFRKAYLPDVADTLNGTGQNVGLLQFDGYYGIDITNYESRGSLPNVVLTNVVCDTNFAPTYVNSAEVSLDIEMVISLAPGVSKVVVYEGSSGYSILNMMATDTNNFARQLSSSWTWALSDDPLADQIFQQFAVQGQSFFNASGDSDAYTGAIPFPSDNPYITTVGGTTLTTTAGGLWSAETVWNSGGHGSSGGMSATYAIPTWQQGINMSTNHGSSTQRNLPDVAMLGNNVSVIYGNQQTNTFAGTSVATPLWGAFAALVNQQAATYGQPPIGFINPSVYAIGQSASYGSAFHDIVTGNNTNSSSPTQFYATNGFDLCTGWGTPAGQALINAFEPPSYLVVSLPVSLLANGAPGGPFSPGSQTFVVSNAGPSSLTWSSTNNAPWLTVSPTNGTLLAGGAGVTITVSLNSTANTLTAGVYSATIGFSDQGAAVTRTRSFSLQVSTSLVQNGGFETGSLTNWTLVGSTSANQASSSAIIPHSGAFVAALGQAGSLGYLSQTQSTIIGQPYLLSFWLIDPIAGTPNQFLANWIKDPTTTNTLFNQTNMGVFAWTNMQFVVVATATKSVLQFGYRDDPNYFGLDDVSLTAIPFAGPAITIGAPSPTATTNGTSSSVSYSVSYFATNFANASLVAGNVSLTNDAVGGTIVVTKNNATNYTVTISGLTGLGSQAIRIASGTATDTAGNPSPAAGPSARFKVQSVPMFTGDSIIANRSYYERQGLVLMVSSNGVTQRILNAEVYDAYGAALDANGDIFIASYQTPTSAYSTNASLDGGIFKLNQYDLTLSEISGHTNFTTPFTLAIEPDGHILVADLDANTSGIIFRVDPATGVATNLASGGNFSWLAGIAVSTNGGGESIFVTDHGDGGANPPRVIQIDPTNGAQTVIFSGAPLQHPDGLALDPRGGSVTNILVADAAAKAIIQLGHTGGSWTASTIVTTPANQLQFPTHVVIDPLTGDFLVTDGSAATPSYSGVGTLWRILHIDNSIHELSIGGFFEQPRGLVLKP